MKHAYPLTLILPFLAVATLSPAAHAEGEACSADSDCGATEHCFDAACAPTDEPITACPDEAQAETACAEWDVCVDGECKRNDPVCRNELGVCFFGAEAGECQCNLAPGIEWGDTPPDVGEFDDLGEQCFATLAATCPGEIPEPECDSDAQRQECEAFVARENEFSETCSGYSEDDPVELSLAVSSCCRDFEFSGIADYRVCVAGLSDGDCDGFDTCANAEPGDGTGTPVDASDQDENAASTDESSGCSVGGSGGGLLGVLMALGFLFRRRRR
mgnify:CR=1 FL=1